MAKKRVVLTGACGYVAQRMIDPLGHRGRERGLPFLVVYGISGNSHRFWSPTNAFDKIGYAPEDDSQVRFAGRIVEIAREKPG